MTSLKTKKTEFKILSILFAIALPLLTFEFIAHLLLERGYGRDEIRDDTRVPEIRSSTPLPFEISAPQPSTLYTPTPVAPTDQAARFPNYHINHVVHTINLPLSNYSGYITRKRSDGSGDIYSIRLSTDLFGRRITDRPQKIKPTKHIVIMGCSFAFGETVQPEDTLAGHLQTLMPEHATYNLSFSGYGPNDVLARSLTHNFMDGMSPYDGTAIYLYSDNHIKRSAGAMNVVGNWGPWSAALKETNGTFEHIGSHLTANRFRTFVLTQLWRSNIVQLFKIDYPLLLTKSHYQKMARELKAIELLYKKKTRDSNRFVVAIYPERLVATDLQKLKSALSEEKIEFIDYSEHLMETRIPEKAGTDYDGHPTSAAYKHLAELLKRDLKL